MNAREMRYEVDAAHTPTCMPIFVAFEGPGMRSKAFRMARSLRRQGFGLIRIQQASLYSGAGDWTRVVATIGVRS